MIVTRPIRDNEPDLLLGHELNNVLVFDLHENNLEEIKCPDKGWTHDKLEVLSQKLNVKYKSGWDAFFSCGRWIGCSEV
ncbi:hypothetical protein ACTTZI_004203 [Vibrio vulnificus]